MIQEIMPELFMTPTSRALISISMIIAICYFLQPIAIHEYKLASCTNSFIPEPERTLEARQFCQKLINNGIKQ
jgi:hypothetical protein